jgi:phosphate-selective porin OprO/OprP
MHKSRTSSLWVAMGIALSQYGGSAALAETDQTVVTHDGPLKWETNDGEFKFQIGGRLMIDYDWYDEDKIEISPKNGAGIRRARLFAAGTMFNVWDWKAQYDFAGNEAEIKDAWIRYTGFKPARITLGQFKQPFSLEELTSSKYITFMERALPTDAFATSRRIGLGANQYADHYTWAVSLYGQEVGNDSSGDNGYGVGARATWAPWNEKTEVLHLGLSGAWENPKDNDVRYRTRPESHRTDTRLVDTGDIPDPDNFTKYGAEAATVWGPFSAQGEYYWVSQESNDISDTDYKGWYAFASWFLTGESRNYKHGAFHRVTPKSTVGKGGIGAWELAARYSWIDLEDSPVTGGKENNVTLGLNWYATKYIRFMANYIFVDADPPASSLQEDGSPSSDKPNIFEMRAQIDF